MAVSGMGAVDERAAYSFLPTYLSNIEIGMDSESHKAVLGL
jgi:hypothetical protein